MNISSEEVGKIFDINLGGPIISSIIPRHTDTPRETLEIKWDKLKQTGGDLLQSDQMNEFHRLGLQLMTVNADQKHMYFKKI